MKYIFIYLIFFSAKAMSQTPITWAAIVTDDRERIKVSLQNSSIYDYFCPRISVKMIYEDPQNYMIVAEVQSTWSDVFVQRSQDGGKSTEELGDEQTQLVRQDYPNAIVRSLEMQWQSSLCRPANIAEYCNSPAVSEDEAETISKIMDQVGAGDCEQLLSKAPNLRRLDLSNSLVSDLRPIRYFKNLQKLNLEGSLVVDLTPIKNQEHLGHLNIQNTRIRSLIPLFASQTLTCVGLDAESILDKTEINKIKRKSQSNRKGLWLGYCPFDNVGGIFGDELY